MMKKSKKRIILIITVLVMCACALASCIDFDNDVKESEYFKYRINGTNGEGEEYIAIKGLTEKGKKLEYLVIPEEIDGIPVEAILGYENTANVKKFYVPCNMRNINSFLGTPSDQFISFHTHYKTFYINTKYVEATQFDSFGYVATIAYDNYFNSVSNCGKQIANVQYLYNYESSPNNGVCFIDDLEVGEKIEVIPDNPKREGYEFTGWYTDTECKNKFDMQNFEMGEEKEILYLYADWKTKK